MNRRVVGIDAPSAGGVGEVIAYGDWGRPLLAFPSEQGRPSDWEERGMIGEIAWLIDGGRAKVYCVDSFDSASWCAPGLSFEERAQRHGLYEDWIVDRVAPWILEDCRGSAEIVVSGASFGAYHSANFALKRADLFPLAICMSGVYDVTRAGGGGESGDAVYFNNPMDYVAHMHGDHLDWLRSRLSVLLVCGQGQWEDTTGALASTQAFGHLLGEKGIRVEVDLWGYDVPHDWPSWRRQLAHHLPRFV